MGAFKIGGLAMQVKVFCKCNPEPMLGVPFTIKLMDRCCDIHYCMGCGASIHQPIVLHRQEFVSKHDIVIEQQLCIPLDDPDVAKEVEDTYINERKKEIIKDIIKSL